MKRYRSFAMPLALAALVACGANVPPHPQGWPQASAETWTTMSGAGPERYQYASTPTTGSLSDLASSQAVATVQRFRGAHLTASIPFPSCPGEAGLARYALPRGVILEVAFAVYNGNAVVVSYTRPKAVAEAPSVTAAMRQAVCYGL